MPGPISRALLASIFGVALTALAPCTSALAWTETVLHAFTGGSDGAEPLSDLMADARGNLYGTTFRGGGHCGGKGCGTVFKVTPEGEESVLYAFQNVLDGKWPVGELILDAGGNLYGTTSAGGPRPCKCGTVFKITPQGVHTILHAFQGFAEGSDPQAGLVADGAGNLYGTVSFGGTAGCLCGAVFKLTPEGAYSVLYSFKGGTDGSDPRASLTFDAGGNLYSSTEIGGSEKCNPPSGCGTIFKLSADGIETVLHVFHGGKDGMFPSPGDQLILDAMGNLYGITVAGGGTGCINGNGCGTVFRLPPDGQKTILSRFNLANGPTNPSGRLARDDKGIIYGAAGGGANGCGSVFSTSRGGNAKAIYSFACGKDGAAPEAGLLLAKDGTLYGTTQFGGNGMGVVYALRET